MATGTKVIDPLMPTAANKWGRMTLDSLGVDFSWDQSLNGPAIFEFPTRSNRRTDGEMDIEAGPFMTIPPELQKGSCLFLCKIDSSC